MKKNKIIYTVLFLTSAVSCSNFRPLVLTNGYLNPISTTEVVYNDINFSYALFNQYASGLRYELRLDYSTASSLQTFNGIDMDVDGVFYRFQDWDFIGATHATAVLSNFWREKFNKILFDRNFNRTTGKAEYTNQLRLRKYGAANSVNLSIKIISVIDYNVNIGSVFMAFFAANAGFDYFKYIYFYNKNDVLLQTILLDQDTTSFGRNYVYDLSTIITNVRRFDLQFQWVDTPPFQTGNSAINIAEFNVFTQEQEISIPEDASGDRFGFEFVAVEWWNILGHLQNFLWYIFNVSPIAPLFQFIEDYVLVWISGLITFITGIFRL